MAITHRWKTEKHGSKCDSGPDKDFDYPSSPFARAVRSQREREALRQQLVVMSGPEAQSIGQLLGPDLEVPEEIFDQGEDEISLQELMGDEPIYDRELGIPDLHSFRRREAFYDTDDDEHVMAMPFGFHITSRP